MNAYTSEEIAARCQAEADELEKFLTKHLPMARAAQVKIDDYTGEQLVVSAPLAENINDKGTAFGGSLYNVCVIAAWGMTHLVAKELELAGDIVVAKGEINYLRPLKSRLIACAIKPEAEQLERASLHHKTRGKSVFSVHVTVMDENQQTCVEFSGKYAVLA
jgi:thioesterase domain-containing protein